MSTGWKFHKACVMVLCAAVLCPGIANSIDTTSSQSHHKAKKPPAPPPDLPSGTTGPVPAIPLDSMAPVPPQVSYQNEQLTIVAPNSTLGDILRAVRKQTGAEIEIPSAPERVVTHLGPGPAREIVAELLNGSRFNYVLLGSAANDALLTRVVLVAKTGSDIVSPPSGPALAEQKPPNSAQQDAASGAGDADATDETTDPAADEAAAEAEQPATPPEQPGVKTPQEMLQEMQQRQLQLQQQQPPGQPPVPGASFPGGRPPQSPPEQQ
jgi:hypothetical protein